MNHNISIEKLEFKVLAPTSADVPRHFKHCHVDSGLHERLIHGIQSVRGLALVECGKAAALLPDGRHFQQIDTDSWHIILQNGEGRILGCARYRPLRGGADQIGASHSALAQSDRYGPALRSGIERLIAGVRQRNKQYGEAGGWALRREIRGSTAAVGVALMTFALAEHLGAGMAITTATRMNHSSSILCRIGANRLSEIPAYYEPRYGSIIEVLHFDLPNQNPRYASKLNKIRSEILNLQVICAEGNSGINVPPPATINWPMPELLTLQ